MEGEQKDPNVSQSGKSKISVNGVKKFLYVPSKEWHNTHI